MTDVDIAQPTVTSGNSYVVPATVQQGTITSWSHDAFNSPNQQITMKVWRRVSGTTYRAVGHDGPRTPDLSVIDSFSGISVPVQAGDVLGLSIGLGGQTNCFFSVPGESILLSFGTHAADGEEATFSSAPGFRANISAVVTPANTFTLGGITRNKKKGTATITATVPNPGELTGSGKGLKVASAAVIAKTVSAPGEVKLRIKAKGKKKTKLNETGKVKVKPKITYIPTGGDPSTQSRKLKLKKR